MAYSTNQADLMAYKFCRAWQIVPMDWKNHCDFCQFYNHCVWLLAYCWKSPRGFIPLRKFTVWHRVTYWNHCMALCHLLVSLCGFVSLIQICVCRFANIYWSQFGFMPTIIDHLRISNFVHEYCVEHFINPTISFSIYNIDDVVAVWHGDTNVLRELIVCRFGDGFDNCYRWLVFIHREYLFSQFAVEEENVLNDVFVVATAS